MILILWVISGAGSAPHEAEVYEHRLQNMLPMRVSHYLGTSLLEKSLSGFWKLKVCCNSDGVAMLLKINHASLQTKRNDGMFQ